MAPSPTIRDDEGQSSDRDELIRTRAYAIWQAEGSPHGRDVQHWAQAVAETDARPDDPSAATQDAAGSASVRRPAKPAATPTTKARRRKAD